MYLRARIKHWFILILPMHIAIFLTIYGFFKTIWWLLLAIPVVLLWWCVVVVYSFIRAVRAEKVLHDAIIEKLLK